MDIEIFPFSVSTEIEMSGRVAFAAFVGGIIGLEQRRAERPAGLRTLALVSMGAAAFTNAKDSVHEFLPGADSICNGQASHLAVPENPERD